MSAGEDRDPVAERLVDVLGAEQRAGMRMALHGRSLALLAVAVLLALLTPPPQLWYYEALLLVLLASGLLHTWLVREGARGAWLGYVLVGFDFALLSYAIMAPNPFAPADWPPQIALRSDSAVYFFLLLALVGFGYSARLVLWAGAMAALAWGAGVAWLASLPGAKTSLGHMRGGVESRLADHLDPAFVNVDTAVQNVVVMLLVAAVVWRSRRLVLRLAAAARERTNRARHFPPGIVERLAREDEPLGRGRVQSVAVLFADIVGFTRLCEGLAPDAVIAFLRAFHRRMEGAVFEHGGTLDKFLGDGLMASFGTPEPGPLDATNALACARAMSAELEDWNRARATAGETPVRIGLGLHYGEVVMGDIGAERRLEFAVLGDTVNVASRLERLTRTLGCELAASEALVRAAERESGAGHGLLSLGERALEGRAAPIGVWTAQAVA